MNTTYHVLIGKRYVRFPAKDYATVARSPLKDTALSTKLKAINEVKRLRKMLPNEKKQITCQAITIETFWVHPEL